MERLKAVPRHRRPAMMLRMEVHVPQKPPDERRSKHGSRTFENAALGREPGMLSGHPDALEQVAE